MRPNRKRLDGQGAPGGEGSEPGYGSMNLVEFGRASRHLVRGRRGDGDGGHGLAGLPRLPVPEEVRAHGLKGLGREPVQEGVYGAVGRLGVLVEQPAESREVSLPCRRGPVPRQIAVRKSAI